MTAQDDPQATWLPVIGKALAYLCMQQAQTKEPDKFNSVLKRVKFLEGLGLPQDDAAEAAGSSAQSVRVLHSLAKTKKVKNGTAKTKSRL